MKIKEINFKVNGDIACSYGVIKNYVWFTPNENTKKYKIQILRNVRKIYNKLLKKWGYLYTLSLNTPGLNKWHSFIGMVKRETITFQNQQYNFWVDNNE